MEIQYDALIRLAYEEAKQHHQYMRDLDVSILMKALEREIVYVE